MGTREGGVLRHERGRRETIRERYTGFGGWILRRQDAELRRRRRLPGKTSRSLAVHELESRARHGFGFTERVLRRGEHDRRLLQIQAVRRHRGEIREGHLRGDG